MGIETEQKQDLPLYTIV